MSFFSRRPHLAPCLIVAAALFIATGRMPYGYYQLLRWGVCGAACYVAWTAYRFDHAWAVWPFIAVAVLFNPIAPFRLSRGTWAVLDAAAAFSFVAAALIVRALPANVTANKTPISGPLRNAGNDTRQAK